MFRALSDNKMLLISTDKGYAFPHEIEAREDPKLVFHGSFSMTVNFHGIGEYFKALGGDIAFQDPKDSIKTVAYAMGLKFQDLPELANAIDTYLQGFGPGDYFSLHRNIREMKDPVLSMSTLLAQLSLSQWDPYVLSCFIPRVLADLPSSSRSLIQGFGAGAKKILKNIYIMPGTEDHYFNTGLLFHTAEDYQHAILCYEKSLKTHGEKFATYYNLGLCCYMAGQFSGSLTYFERSASLATDKRSEEWIQKVKKEMASGTLKSS
jgi:tetratricopeptide (TPR) repeat protein